MNAGRAAAIIVAKEVRAEFRARELLNTTLIFALVVVVIFSFAFDPTAAEARRFGPGLLWIALLFAGSLMLQPSFAREHANDTLDALCLAPVSPFAILLGKIAANFVFLTACEVLLLPVFAVLYNVALLPVLGRLVLVLALGTFGLDDHRHGFLGGSSASPHARVAVAAAVASGPSAAAAGRSRSDRRTSSGYAGAAAHLARSADRFRRDFFHSVLAAIGFLAARVRPRQ